MKQPKHRRSKVANFETITAQDPFGMEVELTVLRSGHKSLKRGAEHLQRAQAALRREEALLLQKYRYEKGNPSLLEEARTEHDKKEQSLKSKTGQAQHLRPTDKSTGLEQDHQTLYELDPEYRLAYDNLQDEHLPLIQKADQLDVAARVRKWKGKGIEAANKWQGGEDLEKVRSVLFDGWGGDEDGTYLIPPFLDAEGNELEEGSKLEAEAERLSLELEEAQADIEQECAKLYASLYKNPGKNDGETPFDCNIPVLTALRAMAMDPTVKSFGYFKRRCLEGVPSEHVASVTDVANTVYEKIEKLNEGKKQVERDYESAVAEAGLRSTGTFTQFEEVTGKEIHVPYAGFADTIAFGLWVWEMSLQAEKAFQEKKRRGMNKR